MSAVVRELSYGYLRGWRPHFGFKIDFSLVRRPPFGRPPRWLPVPTSTPKPLKSKPPRPRGPAHRGFDNMAPNCSSLRRTQPNPAQPNPTQPNPIEHNPTTSVVNRFLFCGFSIEYHWLNDRCSLDDRCSIGVRWIFLDPTIG